MHITTVGSLSEFTAYKKLFSLPRVKCKLRPKKDRSGLLSSGVDNSYMKREKERKEVHN